MNSLNTEIQNFESKVSQLKSNHLDGVEFNLNQDSEKGYIRLFKHLARNGLENVLKFAMQTTSKNTWYKRRAAIGYCCFLYLGNQILNIRNINNQLEHLISEANHLSKFEHNKSRLAQINTDVEKYNLDIETRFKNAERYISLLRSLPDECPIKDSKKNSKRNDMYFLPKDWRQKIINKIDPKYKLDVLLFAITGCRPEELVRGIEATVKSDRLILKIQSAKTKDGKIKRKINNSIDIIDYQAGQEVRELEFISSDKNVFQLQIYNYFFENFKNNPPKLGEPFILKSCFKKNTLQSAISRCAAKLFPNRAKSITPICFRHQLASDLKNLGVDGDQISQMLGHAVDTTKSHYGYPVLGKGDSNRVPSKVNTILRKNDPNSINTVKSHIGKKALRINRI